METCTMALRNIYLNYIQTCVDVTLGELAGKRMLELGDQIIKADSIPETTGKDYYSNRGVETCLLRLKRQARFACHRLGPAHR